MAKIHINIGSNIGDRAALIERAVATLSERLDTKAKAEIWLAPIIESKAWGFDSPHRFLNLGIMIVTDCHIDPETMLYQLLAIEHEISKMPHRQADGSYVDRLIDIDLIAIDDLVVDNVQLQLPHPRMHIRRFVLEPIAALDPEWRHPIYGLTAHEMLDSE